MRKTLAALALAAPSAGASAAEASSAAVAEAQLRATDHRYVDVQTKADASYLEQLNDADFLPTSRSGEWIDRAAMRQPASPSGVAYDDGQARLFGPVAVAHGVLEAIAADGPSAHLRYTDI